MKIWPWSKFAALDTDIQRLEKSIARVSAVVQDRTSISAGIGFHDSYIIVAGRLGNRDYVQCFRLGDDDFQSIAEMLKHMKRDGHIDFIDAPPGFKAVFDV